MIRPWSAMARVIITEETYHSWEVREPLDPYSDFVLSPFWQISQIDHQLGAPLTPVKHAFVQDVEYISVMFECEFIVMRADDTTRFAVLDLTGRQLNK